MSMASVPAKQSKIDNQSDNPRIAAAERIMDYPQNEKCLRNTEGK